MASLLRQDFYKKTGTIEPWPWGCIPEGYWEFYERSGRQPEIVAAIQYALNRSELDRQLLDVPSARRLEIGYSDFVAHPLAEIRLIARAANLPMDRRYEERLSRRWFWIYRDADRKWQRPLTAEHIRRRGNCLFDPIEQQPPCIQARAACRDTGTVDPRSAPHLLWEVQYERRSFEVDPLRCPRCRHEMRIVAFITQPRVIDRILTHLRRTATEPRRSRAPPRRWKSPRTATSA